MKLYFGLTNPNSLRSSSVQPSRPVSFPNVNSGLPVSSVAYCSFGLFQQTTRAVHRDLAVALLCIHRRMIVRTDHAEHGAAKA